MKTNLQNATVLEAKQITSSRTGEDLFIITFHTEGTEGTPEDIVTAFAPIGTEATKGQKAKVKVEIDLDGRPQVRFILL